MTRGLRPIAAFAVGLVKIAGAPWSTAVTRKPARCCCCSRAIAKGVRVYRPVGNFQFRYERACCACVDAALAGLDPCPAECGHYFNVAALGRYGCANCHGEGLD